MKVSRWAEIRRLHEVEGLSRRAIAARLRCCRRTVNKALEMLQPPSLTTSMQRTCVLDPYQKRIEALVARFPELSAVRIWEEIRKGPDGYQGSVITVRRYVRKIRPTRSRVCVRTVGVPPSLWKPRKLRKFSCTRLSYQPVTKYAGVWIC